MLDKISIELILTKSVLPARSEKVISINTTINVNHYATSSNQEILIVISS